MRKEKLIKMLQEIPGNPDILLWNGLVGDWMDIEEVTKCQVVKMTKDYWLELIRMEECVELKDWSHQLPEDDKATLSRRYNKLHDWEFNAYVTDEDIKEKRYSAKTIYCLDAKTRGKTDWGRGGNCDY
jgi:hypothetical protein